MKCPQCGNENLDGSTRCFSCGGGLGDERPARDQDTRGGTSRIVWIVAGVAVAAVLLVAVVAFMRPQGTSGGGPGPSGGSAAAESQARQLDMIGREASAAARRYQLTLTSLTDAATQNEAALEQWSQQRSSNLAAYESEKAAVEHFNATHKGTSGTTKTVYQTVTTGKVKNTTSTTVTIPGEPAQTKPIPPRPEDPPKVTVTLVAQRGQLKRLAVDLRKIQQGLGAVSVDAPFDASLEDATTAVSVLQERVGEARAALGQLVSKGGRRGDVIVAKRLETLSLQGIGESIQKLREDLQAAVARANLDAAILKWATK